MPYLAMVWTQRGKTARPLRYTTLLSVLLDTGIRAVELCGLEMDRLVMNASSAFIVGKGRKDHRCQLGKKASMALAHYLHRERKGCPLPPRPMRPHEGKETPSGLGNIFR